MSSETFNGRNIEEITRQAEMLSLPSYDKISGCLFRTGTEDDTRKYAVLTEFFEVNNNHIILITFDPVKKKYMLCDNMALPQAQALDNSLLNSSHARNVSQ